MFLADEYDQWLTFSIGFSTYASPAKARSRNVGSIRFSNFSNKLFSSIKLTFNPLHSFVENPQPLRCFDRLVEVTVVQLAQPVNHPIDRLALMYRHQLNWWRYHVYVYLHRQISFRDFNSWIVSSNTPLANNTTASTAIATNCTHQRRKSVGSLIAISAAGKPTTQLMIFLICLFFAAISAPFVLRTRVLAVTLVLVEYLRLYILTNWTWLLIIPSQLSVFAKNIPLTFDEATNAERTGFLASFLRQIKKESTRSRFMVDRFD